MTPVKFYDGVSYIFYIGSAGDTYYPTYVTTISGVKPVINLKANSLKSGDGTMNNPFVVG